MAKKKVYICTSGEYSDYGIDAVFDNKADADEFCATFGNNYQIEEWPLGSKSLAPARRGLMPYLIRMTIKGEVFEITKKTSIYYAENASKKYFSSDGENIVTSVWARDEKHAVKIANERRTKAIALEGSVDDERYFGDKTDRT